MTLKLSENEIECALERKVCARKGVEETVISAITAQEVAN